jgi:hypothetical protein
MNAEQQCIEYALCYRRELLDAEIKETRLWSCDGWLSFADCKFDWKPSLAGKLTQMAFWPVAILLVILMALVISVVNFSEQLGRRNTLKREKRQLAQLSIPYEVPAKKNLNALWRHYGLGKRFGDDCGIQLLDRWIEILYGRETADRFDLKARFEEILARQFKANAGWYRGNADALHFHFLPITDCLARELADELPAYCERKL